MRPHHLRTLLFTILVLVWTVPTNQAFASCPDTQAPLQGLSEGDLGSLESYLTAKMLLREGPDGESWLSTIDLAFDLPAWNRRTPDPKPTFCLSVVLETEEGWSIAERHSILLDQPAKSRGWTFQSQLSLPITTSQVFVLLQHPISEAWGFAFADESDTTVRPGPQAVRIDANTWHQTLGGRAVARRSTSADRRAAAIIRLIPPRRQPVSGTTRIQTLISNEAVESVVFFVDGKQVAESKRRPFGARLPLASPAKPQIIRAVAYDAFGKAFGEDEITVNQLDAPFRVQIARIEGDPQSGSIDVTANVTIPPDATLRAVEFYRNEELVTSRKSPPFEATIPTPDISPTDFLRVAVFLDDGSSIDDAILLAAPGADEEVEVNLVELQVVVTDADGQPIEDLEAKDFAIIVDGQKREIESFAYADDVPLTLGIVVDTSGSMRLLMHDTRQAASRFLGSTVLPQDSAFIVDFDQRPRLIQPTTDDMTTLLLSLSRLEAEGTTALYDAVVFSMLQFENQVGRKALVVLSDGDDRDSRFGPKECVTYGHQQGVPVYVIGLGELDTYRRIYPKKELRKITGETGGRLYFVDSFDELDAAYDQIGKELRSQYTLTFYTDRDLSNEERRGVTVRIDRPGATARTVVGVRPQN